MFSRDPQRIRRMGNHSMTNATPMFEAADGRFLVTLLHDRHWASLCKTLGRPDLIDDSRFRDEDSRRLRQADIEEIFNPSLSRRPRAAWVSMLEEARVPVAAERTLAEVTDDEALRSTGILYDELVGDELVTLVDSPLRVQIFGRP